MPCALQWPDIKTLLSYVSLFEGMQLEGLARLASATRVIQSVRGETLFRRDEACNGLHLIVHGRVKLYFSSQQGDEKILDILGPGNAFCESTMFLGEHYQVYAQTLSDCCLMHTSKRVILAELENDPALARRLIESLSQRIFERNAEIESYSLQSGWQRVIHYLLHEMAGTGKKRLREAAQRESRRSGGGDGNHAGRAGNTSVITLITSKSAIASRLNLTQEHFSRILHDLSEYGLIFVDGRDIYVRDVEQLKVAVN